MQRFTVGSKNIRTPSWFDALRHMKLVRSPVLLVIGMTRTVGVLSTRLYAHSWFYKPRAAHKKSFVRSPLFSFMRIPVDPFWHSGTQFMRQLWSMNGHYMVPIRVTQNLLNVSHRPENSPPKWFGLHFWTGRWSRFGGLYRIWTGPVRTGPPKLGHFSK